MHPVKVILSFGGEAGRQVLPQRLTETGDAAQRSAQVVRDRIVEPLQLQIELLDRSHGIRLAIIPSAELAKSARFVLAVHANLPSEALRTNFPTQVKIGPAERIRDLVNYHLPGVSLNVMPIAPREIPYHAGYHYFALDTEHELWKELPRSGGMAMHIAGDFPGLQLEFWAIRN